MAHKKGQGSSRNGRDSNPKVKGGSIIIRQRGTRVKPGENVGLGRDFTIYAKIDGIVKFINRADGTKFVSVIPES